MRHTLVWLAVLVVLLAAQAANASAGSATGSRPIVISVNGQPQHFDTPPLEVSGHVLVPLRGVFESLGAVVIWSEDTGAVTVQSSQQVRLRVGSREAFVGDRAVKLEIAPRLYQGRVYVPLRFVSESLGASVAWSPTQRRIEIATAAPSVAGFRREPVPPAKPVSPEPSIQSAPPDKPAAPAAPEAPSPAAPDTSSDSDAPHQWKV